MVLSSSDTLQSDQSRAQRLKAFSHRAHDRLDTRIMAGDPFASQANYLRFLRVQYLFHRDIDALYCNPAIGAFLPDLAERRRLPLILQDLADLGEREPAAGAEPLLQGEDTDLPSAFGWLYVAEGSNLGAAFLLKAAAHIGLGADFGARHLAGHLDSREQHWRAFTGVLNRLALSQDEEGRLFAAAQAAFATVHARVENAFD